MLLPHSKVFNPPKQFSVFSVLSVVNPFVGGLKCFLPQIALCAVRKVSNVDAADLFVGCAQRDYKGDPSCSEKSLL